MAATRFPVFLSMKGCQRRCVYCDQKAITGQEPPSPEDVKREIGALHRKIDEICLFGGSFTCLPVSTQDGYLNISKDLSIPTRMSTHPLCIDEETLDRLSDYPISMIELGISSLDDGVLSLCRRGYTGEEAIKAMKMILDRGFPLCAQMMIGLPGQTKDSSLKDLSLLERLKGPRDMTLRIYPCLVLKNTELESMIQEGYRPISVDEAVSWGGEILFNARRKGFYVQRIGLSETQSLSDAVVGGPHHPALGEIIRGEAMAKTMSLINPGGPWNVDGKKISLLMGHNARGMKRLAEINGIAPNEAKKRIFVRPSVVD